MFFKGDNTSSTPTKGEVSFGIEFKVKSSTEDEKEKEPLTPQQSKISLSNEFKWMIVEWFKDGKEDFLSKIILVFATIGIMIFGIYMVIAGDSWYKRVEKTTKATKATEEIHKVLPFMPDLKSDNKPVEVFGTEQIQKKKVEEQKVEEQPVTKSEPELEDDVIKKLKEIL